MMAVTPFFLLHSSLLALSNAVFPLQTPAPVMELVDVPDSKSGAARRGGSSPPRGTTIYGFTLLNWTHDLHNCLLILRDQCTFKTVNLT